MKAFYPGKICKVGYRRNVGELSGAPWFGASRLFSWFFEELVNVRFPDVDYLFFGEWEGGEGWEVDLHYCVKRVGGGIEIDSAIALLCLYLLPYGRVGDVDMSEAVYTAIVRLPVHGKADEGIDYREFMETQSLRLLKMLILGGGEGLEFLEEGVWDVFPGRNGRKKKKLGNQEGFHALLPMFVSTEALASVESVKALEAPSIKMIDDFLGKGVLDV